MPATKEPPEPTPAQTEAAAKIYAASLSLRTAYRKAAQATKSMEAAMIAGMKAGIPFKDILSLTADMDDYVSRNGISGIAKSARAKLSNYRKAE